MSPWERYGTRATTSSENPAGRKTFSTAKQTDSSQEASRGNGRHSRGASRLVPRSTKGRQGRTNATSKRPEPGLNRLRTSASKESGRSQRSSTFRSATQSAMPSWPGGIPAAAILSKTVPKSSSSKASKPRHRNLRNIGPLASVSATLSNNGASSVVTSPAPAPTSSRRPPGRWPPKRRKACEVLRTKSPPRPTRPFASVCDMYLRRTCAATSFASCNTPQASAQSCKKRLLAMSRLSATKRPATSGGSNSKRHPYCNSAAGKRWLQWAHVTLDPASQSSTLW
mmetsp:Transcript_3261/g.6521  ORF Transcript_3261/g.6521 Transcript_3261/m.6521 type:complete len:283 (+) Transcript_3261:104-952(+)